MQCVCVFYVCVCVKFSVKNHKNQTNKSQHQFQNNLKLSLKLKKGWIKVRIRDMKYLKTILYSFIPWSCRDGIDPRAIAHESK